MPSPYRRDAARLKAEIVGRVLAGESLRAIGATPGLPGAHTVCSWARADAGFAAELATARARADGARLRFDEAVAAAFLARARAGEPINSLLREPGMPGRRAYRTWLAQAPFAEAIFALRQRRDQALGLRGRRRRRAFDAAVADRIVLAVHHGASLGQALSRIAEAPSLPVVRRWRREQPEFDAELRVVFAVARRQQGARVGCTPGLTDRIVDRIVEGGSFASIGREPGMPSRQTLRRWVRVRPEFAEAVAWACDAREDWYHDQIQMIAEEATPGTAKETRRRMGPLLRQLVRLRHRPGAVHRKAGKPSAGSGG